jgi:hypothetical protein
MRKLKAKCSKKPSLMLMRGRQWEKKKMAYILLADRHSHINEHRVELVRCKLTFYLVRLDQQDTEASPMSKWLRTQTLSVSYSV